MQEAALHYIELYGVAAVFVFMATNGFASLPPSEAVYGLAGVLVHAGRLPADDVLVAGVAGNVLGTTLLYAAGRLLGYSWLLRLRDRLLARRGVIGRAAEWLPGRPVLRYFEQFLRRPGGFTLLGCAVWAGAWVGLGYLAGEGWRRWSPWVTVVLLAILVGLLVTAKRAMKRSLDTKGG